MEIWRCPAGSICGPNADMELKAETLSDCYGYSFFIPYFYLFYLFT